MRRFLESPPGKYVIALAAVAVALALRALLDRWMGAGGATITLYGAIAVAVWFGGYKPGLFAAIVGYLGVVWLFRSASAQFDVREGARLVGFLLSASLIIALGGAMHAARRRAEVDAATARRRAEELEREVEDHRKTRSSLEARDRELAIVTDTMSAAVARCSADRRYLWVSPLYALWLGKTPDEVVGRRLEDVIGREALHDIEPHIREVLTGRRVEYERFSHRPTGQQRWIHVILEPTRPPGGGSPDGWVAVVHDIDDSKRAAEALREARNQLQAVTDNMPAAVIRTGNDLRLQWMNPEYERWIGRPARQLLGTPLADAVGAEGMREIGPSIARVLQGERVEYERLATLPGMPGGKRWIHGVLTPVRDGSGQPDGWVAILHDVHDRKLAEEGLREADRRKDDFLATLAHELRNPLAPIRNATAILARKGPLDPELAWSREVIGRQVEQMSRLIDDLLDIERISRGKFLVRKERILLERAIDMALEMSRPYITAAGHRLSVLMPAERAVVDADPTRLAQVFSNLLNNAAKFTEPRGSIALSAQVEGNAAVVSVEDTGIGFAPGGGARLFKPYTQLADGAGRPAGQGGLGIGLSLVHGIVTLHGGKVEAHSEGPGKGARFTVRLPLAAPVAAPQKEAATGEVATVPPPGFRVMIADDNKDAADSLQRILLHYGYNVKVAYDGPSALELARGFAPQTVVLDIDMPGMSGYEVALVLKRELGAVPLVALTGWGQEGDRRRAMEAGFDHHLTKPVDPTHLNDLLAEVAHRSRKNAHA